MFLFIFETERDRAWAGEGQREGETQNLKQAPGSELSAQSLDVGLKPTSCEIMTWAEVRRLTNWATQAPQNIPFYGWIIFCYLNIPRFVNLFIYWVVPTFWLLWIILLSTLVCKYRFESLFSILWAIYLKVELLGHVVILYITLK